MQILMSVQQTTERVALTLSALTLRAVVSVGVNQDTAEMDKVAPIPVAAVRILQAYIARISCSLL